MEALWYALRVKPRYERSVDEHLRSKGYETFLPSKTEKTKWSDRIKSTITPLFPGYTFCRFSFHARLPIIITPGVQFVVGAGKAPLPVEEHEIVVLRRVVVSEMPLLSWPYLKVGQTVQVETGPLQGLSGVIVRVKNIDRLVVSISLLMRSVAVEVPRESVRPLNKPSATRGERRFLPV
jgi:transcription antitermination factor NusG